MNEIEITQDFTQQIVERHMEQLDQAYQLGLLHGINAQVLASAERDVLEFEDMGWSIDERGYREGR